MKSEHGAHGAMMNTAKLRRGTNTKGERTWEHLTMGHSHTPRAVRKYWWQFWRPKALVVRVGTMMSMANEYGLKRMPAAPATVTPVSPKPLAFTLDTVMNTAPAWEARPYDEYARYGGRYSKAWGGNVPPGCKDCPWDRGDITTRDCGYPHCSP